MVSLVCFCCDHRNPLGARFCNACGTPMHLRPCRHCEAINARAAAHCHQCGEAFEVAFIGDEPPEDHASAAPAPPGASSAPDDAHIAPAGARLGWRRALPAALAVLSVGALLVLALGPSLGGLAAETGSGGVREAVLDPLPAVNAPATPSPEAVYEPPRVTPATTGAGPAKTSRAPRKSNAQAAAKPRGAKRAPAASSKASTASASRSAKAGARVAQRRGQPSRSTAAATRGSPDADQRRDHVAQASASERGRWNPPCAEGGALEPGCDVRLIPKGN